jgi:hypothetical protein
MMSEASHQFENQITNCLRQAGNIVICPNSPSRGQLGFVGHRKPDLLSIDPNLRLTVWELKTQAECTGIDNASRNHIWFRHPTPSRDYISEVRQRFRQDDSILAPVAGWCIVLQGELAYWYRNIGTDWRHPLEMPLEGTILAGVAAPLAQHENITTALQHLCWINWEHSTQSGMTIHSGSLTGAQLEGNQE